jgi:hypothetical protein
LEQGAIDLTELSATLLAPRQEWVISKKTQAAEDMCCDRWIRLVLAYYERVKERIADDASNVIDEWLTY